MASADLPAPVGPQMTRTLLSSEAPVELIPGDLHDRGPTMHVVGRQRRGGETHVERLHLRRRERVASFDGGFARDGGGEAFVASSRTRHTIAGERIQRVSQAA